jgi:glycosyltransferase involved in cell wall biosynthesis
MPRVSVIIPAHNAADHLPETLDSVRAQTFSDWEIVAVDDGSRDETWEMLQHAGPQVRALRSEVPGGPAAARNRALAVAHGELIAFLDSDDVYEPNYLERQIEVLETAQSAGRRVGLVCCDARLLDPDGLASHTYLEMFPGWDQPLTLERVLTRNPIFTAALVPAEVGRAVGWFDEELAVAEDYGLWLKILERGYEAVLNPEPLVTYRRRHGSLSSDIARQGAYNRQVFELALARGRLDARQGRIARRAIHYNRAMEEVARLRFGTSERSLAAVARSLPLLLWVAVTSPRWWGQWLRILGGATHPAPRSSVSVGASLGPDEPGQHRPTRAHLSPGVAPLVNDDITVIITCFDYGAYLPEAVQSALAQEGGPPRVIVVDDGSTDPGTLQALDRLPMEVEVIRQPNAGLSLARNTGLSRASTPFLIVLDADDRLTPHALLALRAALEADPQLGFSYGITEFFGDWQGVLSFPPFDPYKLLYRHIIGSTALMRRELYEQVGGFDPAFRRYEDWEFWVSALAHGWRGQRVDEVTFLYRRHGHTMNADARAHYRHWYRQQRRKHADIYSRESRRRLADESDLDALGRAIYRWWWGARPIPARVEGAVHTLLWRAKAGRR